MRWLEVAVRCRRAAWEAVAALIADLTGAGADYPAGGVVVEDPLDVARGRQRWELTDLVPGDPAWVTVKGYLTQTAADQGLQLLQLGLDRIRAAGLGTVDDPVAVWVDETDWATAWQAYWQPQRIGRRLVVVPSWETFTPEPGDLVITLDPGMAFGTGSHATTALCLCWLEDLVPPARVVVDVGTGSGILAVAAALLGAGPVLALDTDATAVQAARANVARAGEAVAAAVSCLKAEFSAAAVTAWLQRNPPHLVVANIITGVIVELAPAVAAALGPDGLFLAAGITSGRRGEAEAALRRAGLVVLATREEAGWVALLSRAAPVGGQER